VIVETGDASGQSPDLSGRKALAGIFDGRRARWCALSVAALWYLACCFSMALTRAPWYDEGFFANPAYAWITTGHPGISVLDDTGPFLPSPKRIEMRGIKEHLYLAMPLHMVFLATWFKVFGFGLVTMRLFTALCGLVVLLSWYCVVRRLTSNGAVAVTSFAVIAADYGFIWRCSEGRMDALSAAFGFAGLAVYLSLRERHFTHAVLWSHACVAASAFSHPNGGVLAFAGLVFLSLFYDHRRIRLRDVALALCPYLVAAAGWALYINQDVAAFKSQFLFNALQGGRLDTFRSPWSTLQREIVERYLGALGGLGDVVGRPRASQVLRKLKLPIPISYGAGLAGVLSIGALRRQRGYQALIFLSAIYFFVLAFADGRKSQCYVVHIIPVFGALLAASLVWLWQKGRAYRGAAVAAAGMLFIIHTGGIFYRVKEDSYHQSYLPAIRFLQENSRSDQMIMGPGILGFGLRYPPNLMDDFRLGYLNRKTPDWIVVNDFYTLLFLELKTVEQDAYQFVRARLDSEFMPVYDKAGIVIYRKR
jgi:4-amino-4-deoxy-L-arabinose transferase-like glycosyltransferase